MDLGAIRKAEKQRVVGGARRRKLAQLDLGEVTRKSQSLPGGFKLDFKLTRKDIERFWKLQRGQGMQKKWLLADETEARGSGCTEL